VTPGIGLSDVEPGTTAAARLAGKILTTPVWRWQTGVIEERSTAHRGLAETRIISTDRPPSSCAPPARSIAPKRDPAARGHGVVAVSAGIHAIALPIRRTARHLRQGGDAAARSRLASRCGKELGADVILVPMFIRFHASKQTESKSRAP